MKGFYNDHNPVRIASNVQTYTYIPESYGEYNIRLMTLAGAGPEPKAYILGVDICTALHIYRLGKGWKGLTRVDRNSLGLGRGCALVVLSWDEASKLIKGVTYSRYSKDTAPHILYETITEPFTEHLTGFLDIEGLKASKWANFGGKNDLGMKEPLSQA